LRRTALAPLYRWSWLVDLLAAPPPWLRSAPVLGCLAIFVGVVAATVGFQAAYADRVAAGVTVMGVELGGRTKAEARALLAAEAAELGRQPVTLRAGGREWQFAARDLGVNVDADSLVEDAYGVGRSGNPVQRGASQWAAYFFSRQFGRPAPRFDLDRQEAELRGIAAQLDRPARDAQIKLVPAADGPIVTVTPEQAGFRLLVDESAQRLRDALTAGVPAAVDLVVETENPTATASDYADAQSQAERIVSEPLVISFQDKRWTIGRDEVGRTLAFERQAGQPAQVTVNPAALNATFERIAKEVDQTAQSARFEWTGSALRTIRDSQDGRAIDLDALRAQVSERLMADEHAIALPVAITQPAVSTADASKISIQGVIREGRTSFAGATPEKAHNVGLAASRLNGVVVPPGGLFSFNREVGPTTLDAGFRTGWGITLSNSGAKTVPSVAGGICQVATTLFQPVFHAGYAIEERHWHLYWINSYGQPPLGMKGLDATVDEDYGLDFQFINTTSDYLLIQSRVDGSTLVFGLWGVKPSWDVKIDGPVVTNVVAANRETVHENEPTMPAGRTLQVEAAQDGLEAVITRTVTTAGQEPRTLRMRSNYLPARNVVLMGTGSA